MKFSRSCPCEAISHRSESALKRVYFRPYTQIIYCDNEKMSGQRVYRAKDQSAPFIPQPDYTPLPPRRNALSPLSPKDLASVPSLPRLDEKSKPPVSYYSNKAFDAVPEERAWDASRWNSSQFLASDCVALMQKKLCLEAKSRREERIRSQVDKTLENFEKEMDLYLDEEEERKHRASKDGSVSGLTPSQSSSSLPRVPSEGASGSGSSGRSSSRSKKAERDQISVESGYISAYPAYLHSSGARSSDSGNLNNYGGC